MARRTWSQERARTFAAHASKPSVLASMNKLVYDPQGFAPVLDFTKPGTALGGALPRLVNTKVMYARVKNGQIKALNGGKFIDPFAVPKSSSSTTTTTK